MVRDRGELSQILGADVAIDNMIQFVQGYILAMEDILRDIESITCLSTSSRDYTMGHDHALEDVKSRAEESRDSARRTLEILTNKADSVKAMNELAELQNELGLTE